VLSEALTSDPIHAALLEKVSANPALKDKMLRRSTVLQVLQLTGKSMGGGGILYGLYIIS